jgi:hypothetical protein
MAPKKAKVSLPPLLFPVPNAIQSDEIPSPLTPLSTDLKEAPTQRQSALYWHRYAAQGFRLPGEPKEALDGPDPSTLNVFTTKQRANTCVTEPESDIIQIKLTDAIKKIIDVVSGDIIRTWPPYPEESKNTLLFVNGYAFVTQAFKPRLQPLVNEAINLQQRVGKCFTRCI